MVSCIVQILTVVGEWEGGGGDSLPSDKPVLSAPDSLNYYCINVVFFERSPFSCPTSWRASPSLESFRLPYIDIASLVEWVTLNLIFGVGGGKG